MGLQAGGCCGGRGSEVVQVAKMNPAAAPGPRRRRQCRDVPFLLIFVAFWCGMLYIAYESVSNGEPQRLVHGVDSFGNLCGQPNPVAVIPNSTNSGIDMTNRPFLFYHMPENEGAPAVCVSECPSPAEDLDCSGCSEVDPDACRCRTTTYDLCLDSQDGTYTLEGLHPRDAQRLGCPEEIYRTDDYLGIRKCVPFIGELTNKTASFFKILDSQDVLGDVISDMDRAKYLILTACAGGAAVSLLVLILLRWAAGPLVWGLVMTGWLAITALAAYLWLTYFQMHEDWVNTAVELRYKEDGRNTDIVFGLAIAASCIWALVSIILAALRSYIAFVVAIFKEASKCIARIPWVLLMPLMTAVVLLAFFAYWVVVYMFLATSGDSSVDEFGHVAYDTEKTFYRMWWYHLLGLFWVSQFIVGCQHVAIAGVVSAWYFARDKRHLGNPVLRSIWNVIRYHLGSVAFGSFIVALVQMIRYALMYVDKKLKGRAGPVVGFLLKCCGCCMWCLEKFLKFINKNAYIEIAIYGYSFCTAAREAFKVLAANIIRIVAINSVGAFILFMARLAVVGITGAVSLYFLRQQDALHSYVIPLLSICVFTYFISKGFLGVYKMAIDTLVICFCEDHKFNDGSPEKPFFMSDNLRSFISRAERRVQAETDKRTDKTPLLAETKQ